MSDADIAHLVERRDLAVPEQDRAALVDYWRRIRALRAEVDPALLADAEIAVTWTAVTWTAVTSTAATWTAVAPDAG